MIKICSPRQFGSKTNNCLKRIVANKTLEIDAIKTVLEKKYGLRRACKNKDLVTAPH